MKMNNKIAIIISYLFFLAVPVLFLYIIYIKFAKSPFGKIANIGNSLLGEAENVYNKAGNAMSAILEPLDKNLTEDEKSKYIKTFAKESVKNLLDPREWVENLSYWWS